MPLRDLLKESPSTKTILMDSSCASTSSMSVLFRFLKGWARENARKAWSLVTEPIMVMAISWFATTDRGHSLPEKCSSSLVPLLLATTRDSATSSGAVASILALMVSPILWPARPARWIMRETCLGELYCMTMSVDPTSMPSSRDEVHIRDFTSPALNFSSISILFSLEREPWWTSTDMDSSHRW